LFSDRRGGYAQQREEANSNADAVSMRSALVSFFAFLVVLFSSSHYLGSSSSSTVFAMSTGDPSPPMKRILVTGANKGIGQAICEKLLKEYPDTFVFLGSRDLGRGNQAVQSLCESLGDSVCDGRLQVVQIDTSSDASVEAAFQVVSKTTGGEGSLYGIVNNAGVIGLSPEEVLNVNYFGPRRVNTIIGKLLRRPGGRIVNMSSASGPYFLQSCGDGKLAEKLGFPMSHIAGGVKELDQLAKSSQESSGGDSYGLSKALLGAYTALQAKEEPDLIINACSPGWIKTDMTIGQGASNPPSKGAIPPVWLLMSPDLESNPSGRYYGSDCIRSPLHKYRDPGDPPYEGP